MTRDKVLHPMLEPGLQLLPENHHVHLLTRHSIREMAHSHMVSYDLPLTAEGLILAEQWGEMLTRPIETLYSSVVGRCVDTAQAMMKGNVLPQQRKLQNDDIPILEEKILKEPGCFVSDIALAGPNFKKVGPIKFVSQHLSYEISEGLVPPHVGANCIFEYLQAREGLVNTLSVHVTHDTILATFVYFLQDMTDITEDHWPWIK